jgi:CheY-like chemotaxis protein
VLVAENEAPVRSLTVHVLRGLGDTVLEARDGSGAIRIGEWHRGSIHLLVTDVMMPRAGGRGGVTASAPRPAVLYISGYAGDAVVRHGVEEGGVNFLQKPFTPAALARKVRAVLDSPRPPSGDQVGQRGEGG